MSSKFKLAMIVCAALGLQACSSGIFSGEKTPDEFNVVSKPKLSMPPDYNLRPPRPGLSEKQELPASTRALTILFGDGNASVRPASRGEQALLDTLDARGRSVNARSLVGNKDNVVVEKGALLDDMMLAEERDGSFDKSRIIRVTGKADS